MKFEFFLRQILFLNLYSRLLISFCKTASWLTLISEYEKNPAYFGALIGRIANRIYQGKFCVDGKGYSVAVNRDPNHLHGGLVGFDKVNFLSVFSP